MYTVNILNDKESCQKDKEYCQNDDLSCQQ